ncbi:hypothetical protein L7F22_050966 [Adiantum nelumboides]|nr:hypothetical protein [Adiantum nelumboides]
MGRRHVVARAAVGDERERASRSTRTASGVEEAGLTEGGAYKRFVHTISTAAAAGTPITPAGSETLRTTRLTRQVDIVYDMLDGHRQSWALYGCAIISDGGEDTCKRHVLNILVFCCTSTTFLRAIDVSIAEVRITGSLIIVVDAADVSNLKPHTAKDNAYDFIREDMMRFSRQTCSTTRHLRGVAHATVVSSRPSRGRGRARRRRGRAAGPSIVQGLTSTPSECESEDSDASDASQT